MIEITGLEEVKALLLRLVGWSWDGSRKNVDKAAKDIASLVKENMKEGRDSDGVSFAPLAKATIEGPVRREGNSQKRSGSIPLVASGRTADSIGVKKPDSETWEITSTTSDGQKILASNAKESHNGFPFIGDTPKPIRDPLVVSEKHLDLLENEIIKGIEEVLNG